MPILDTIGFTYFDQQSDLLMASAKNYCNAPEKIKITTKSFVYPESDICGIDHNGSFFLEDTTLQCLEEKFDSKNNKSNGTTNALSSLIPFLEATCKNTAVGNGEEKKEDNDKDLAFNTKTPRCPQSLPHSSTNLPPPPPDDTTIWGSPCRWGNSDLPPMLSKDDGLVTPFNPSSLAIDYYPFSRQSENEERSIRSETPTTDMTDRGSSMVSQEGYYKHQPEASSFLTWQTLKNPSFSSVIHPSTTSSNNLCALHENNQNKQQPSSAEYINDIKFYSKYDDSLRSTQPGTAKRESIEGWFPLSFNITQEEPLPHLSNENQDCNENALFLKKIQNLNNNNASDSFFSKVKSSSRHQEEKESFDAKLYNNNTALEWMPADQETEENMVFFQQPVSTCFYKKIKKDTFLNQNEDFITDSCLTFYSKTTDSSRPCDTDLCYQPQLSFIARSINEPVAMFRVIWEVGHISKFPLNYTDETVTSIVSPKFATKTDLKNVWVMFATFTNNNNGLYEEEGRKKKKIQEQQQQQSSDDFCQKLFYIKFTSTSKTFVKFGVKCGSFRSDILYHHFKKSPWSPPAVISGSFIKQKVNENTMALNKDSLQICIEFYDILFPEEKLNPISNNNKKTNTTPTELKNTLLKSTAMTNRPRSVSVSVLENANTSITTTPLPMESFIPLEATNIHQKNIIDNSESAKSNSLSHLLDSLSQNDDLIIPQSNKRINFSQVHQLNLSCKNNIPLVVEQINDEHWMKDSNEMISASNNACLDDNANDANAAELLAEIIAAACLNTSSDVITIKKLFQIATSVCLPLPSADSVIDNRSNLLFKGIQIFVDKHLMDTAYFAKFSRQAINILQEMLLNRELDGSRLLINEQIAWIERNLTLNVRRDTVF